MPVIFLVDLNHYILGRKARDQAPDAPHPLNFEPLRSAVSTVLGSFEDRRGGVGVASHNQPEAVLSRDGCFRTGDPPGIPSTPPPLGGRHSDCAASKSTSDTSTSPRS